MAITGQNIIDEFLRKYRNCDSTFQLTLLQRSHNAICRDVKIYPDTSEDISLVVGTREYSISANVLRIWAAAYYQSATSYFPMEECSIDELDYESKGWRGWQTGQPLRWYTAGTVVGFDITPSVSTTGGYPLVRLYEAQSHTLGASDSLPATINDPTPWVTLMQLMYAKDRYAQDIELNKQVSDLALQDLKKDIFGLAPRQKPTARYNTPRLRH